MESMVEALGTDKISGVKRPKPGVLDVRAAGSTSN